MDKAILASFLAKPHPKTKFENHTDDMIDALKYWKTQTTPPVYHHQINAVLETLRQYLADEEHNLKEQLKNANFETLNEPMVIVAPTGAGKTGIITFLPYVLSAKRVLILSPSRVISEQISEAFLDKANNPCFFRKIGLVPDGQEGTQFIKSVLEDIGVIRRNADIYELAPLMVVNAQRFGGNAGVSLIHNNQEIVSDVTDFFSKFDTLIVDEAHHYPARTWENIVKQFRQPADGYSRKKIVFLTATPDRMVENERVFILGNENINRITYRIDRKDLEEKGIIRKCKFREVDLEPTPENLFRNLQQIFHEQQQVENRFMAQAMVLVRTKLEAADIAEKLNQLSGDNFAVAVNPDNPYGLPEFTRGKFRVAITCGVALEGYDNPNVVACVVKRKIVTGKNLFQQFAGRCMRVKRGLGEPGDQTTGIVLSYKDFNLQQMWEEIRDLEPVLPENDPVELDDVAEHIE